MIVYISDGAAVTSPLRGVLVTTLEAITTLGELYAAKSASFAAADVRREARKVALGVALSAEDITSPVEPALVLRELGEGEVNP